MTSSVNINRCLTMAAYSAFVVLRDYLSRNPVVSINDAIKIVRNANTDNSALDYEGGAIIYKSIQIDISDNDRQTMLRQVVCELVKITNPWWLRMFPYGRERVKKALSQDQIQCLREAGLFDPVPVSEVISWWDEIAATVRGVVDVEKMRQAREAENLSMDYERNRLKSLGVPREPNWVSLEDNTLGYDIKSYDIYDNQILNRLIEVKSTTSNSIYISKNEWLNAKSAKMQYCFHVWKFPQRRLVEYSVSSMRSNMPIDQGAGDWQQVLIYI